MNQKKVRHLIWTGIEKFCGQCGHSLTEEAKAQEDDISHQLHTLFAENPKHQPLFTELMKELKR